MSSVLRPLFWPQSDILFLSFFFHFCWTCSLLFIKDSILSLLSPLTSFFPQLLFFKYTFILFYYYFLIWPYCTSCRILVSPTRGWTWGPAVKAPSSNQWAPREIPAITFWVRAYFVSDTAFGDAYCLEEACCLVQACSADFKLYIHSKQLGLDLWNTELRRVLGSCLGLVRKSARIN